VHVCRMSVIMVLRQSRAGWLSQLPVRISDATHVMSIMVVTMTSVTVMMVARGIHPPQIDA
jgi:hypothetical protein